MDHVNLDRWLRRLRSLATFVFIAALCLAVALLVIAFIPGSPVTEDLPASSLKGLGAVGGLTAGVAVDTSGWVPFSIDDPSLPQRMLYLLTVFPGLLLVAEIARRMARLLRAAEAQDPFTADTARALWGLGKVTAFAGLGTWVLSQVASGLLSATMLDPSPTYKPHESPLGWLAVGLIFAGFSMILNRGVAMRAELDTVI